MCCLTVQSLFTLILYFNYPLQPFMFQTLLQEVRHIEVNASKHNEFLNAKLRDVSIHTFNLTVLTLLTAETLRSCSVQPENV